MSNLPMFPEHDSGSDDTPLPLLVAKKWGFPLAFHVIDSKYMYAIQDWIRGLTGEEDIRKVWTKFKRQKVGGEMFVSSIHRMSYTAADGKTYKREFTTAENLILIMQYLRDLESRPILRDAKVFLNQLLVLRKERSSPEFTEMPDFVPLASYDTLTSNPPQDSNLADHSHLLASFVGRTQDEIKPPYYDLVTNDISIGLWKRSSQQLKLQLGSISIHLNKDHMSPLACSFHEMLHEMVKIRLAYRQDLWCWEIRQCVKDSTIVVRNMINQAEVFLQIDIATGRSLISS
jgi:hypothetical protein